MDALSFPRREKKKNLVRRIVSFTRFIRENDTRG